MLTTYFVNNELELISSNGGAPFVPFLFFPKMQRMSAPALDKSRFTKQAFFFALGRCLAGCMAWSKHKSLLVLGGSRIEGVCGEAGLTERER
jgi:hypothetical protein